MSKSKISVSGGGSGWGNTHEGNINISAETSRKTSKNTKVTIEGDINHQYSQRYGGRTNAGATITISIGF